MDAPVVIAFKETWPGLHKNLRDANPESYYFHLFKVLVNKGNKGFRHTKIYAASSKGTSIKFKPIDSQEEADTGKASLLALAKEYNEKYNTGIEFEEEEIDE